MTCAVTNSLNSVGSQLPMDTCDVHAVLTSECVGKNLRGDQSHHIKPLQKKILRFTICLSQLAQ